MSQVTVNSNTYSDAGEAAKDMRGTDGLGFTHHLLPMLADAVTDLAAKVTAAGGSQTAAAGSATSAAGSATTATTKADEASASAAAAAGSASTATTQASAASSSAAAAAAAAASVGYQDVVFITSASSPYTVAQATAGKLIACDTTGGNIIINLPTISGLTLPFVVGVKKTTSDANTVTINRGGTNTFDDGTTSKAVSVPAGFTLIPDVDASPDVWTAIGFGGTNAGPATSSGLTLATAKILGRNTAGTGAIEEIPLASQAEMEAGTETLLRAMSPVRVKQAIDKLMATKGADIASAGTVNLDTATGNLVHITGTTTITAITLASGAERDVVFDGALTLTHNATTLILPGGANITTAAGDRATFRGDGTGNVCCIHYTKASGLPIVAAAQNLVLLATLTPTAAAAVDALSVFSATYDNYLIIGQGILPAANDSLRMRMATGGAADGANKYFNDDIESGTATTYVESWVNVSSNAINSAGIGGNFVIHVVNANSTSLKSVTGKCVYQAAGTATYGTGGVHGMYVAANTISGVRFLWNAGSNFAAVGKIYIYGYKG